MDRTTTLKLIASLDEALLQKFVIKASVAGRNEVLGLYHLTDIELALRAVRQAPHDATFTITKNNVDVTEKIVAFLASL